MIASLLAAAAFQVGPFYEQRDDYWALRPFVSQENGETDVLWPLFTKHRDWWRFCYLVNSQDYPDTDGGYQFSVVPFWFNGHDPQEGGYWGFFPFYGHHPHIGMMYDFDFALWPVWHRYRMPRGRDWLETNSVFFPFVSWRSDGAWSLWPFYGVNYQRESDHRYALWPLVTWASYRDDRDTSGEGYSWSVLPFYSRVRRRYEEQDSFLPPFFSIATTWGKRPPAAGELVQSGPESVRVRCPWPFVEYESTPVREHLSLWPFYESDVHYEYLASRAKGKCPEAESSHVTRFGWKLVELYDDEVRVFPFYASGRDHTRVWPFWESETEKDVTRTSVLALFPIRWVPAVDRNWAKFWTLYENASYADHTEHSLLWGLIRWRTEKE